MLNSLNKYELNFLDRYMVTFIDKFMLTFLDKSILTSLDKYCKLLFMCENFWEFRESLVVTNISRREPVLGVWS